MDTTYGSFNKSKARPGNRSMMNVKRLLDRIANIFAILAMILGFILGIVRFAEALMWQCAIAALAISGLSFVIMYVGIRAITRIIFWTIEEFRLTLVVERGTPLDNQIPIHKAFREDSSVHAKESPVGYPWPPASYHDQGNKVPQEIEGR